MRFQNPDPYATDMCGDMYRGFEASLNGTLRTRYDILKDLNATDENQKEMRTLTAFLVGIGVATGMAMQTLAIILFLLITYLV